MKLNENVSNVASLNRAQLFCFVKTAIAAKIDASRKCCVLKNSKILILMVKGPTWSLLDPYKDFLIFVIATLSTHSGRSISFSE